jgi:hypothetical protein
MKNSQTNKIAKPTWDSRKSLRATMILPIFFLNLGFCEISLIVLFKIFKLMGKNAAYLAQLGQAANGQILRSR